MKILWLAIILSVFATGCSNDQQKGTKIETVSGEAKHEHEAAKEKLELNNNAKWKADSSTNNNVKNLQAIVEKFNSGTDKPIGAYTATGSELQGGLDKMIAECKMKGPDHEALHKWLEPLIGNVRELKKASNEQEAANIIKEIDQHLKLYAQYFE
jgi:hypothetical protein